MKKLKSGYISIMSLLLMLFLCCALSVHSPVAFATEQGPQTITISAVQYKTLKEQLQQQETTLLMLKAKLEMLELPSTRLVQQLEIAEQELKKCKEELTSAKLSLTNASASIDNLKLSLTKLETQIEEQQRKAKIARAQRDAWAAVAIIIGLLAVCK